MGINTININEENIAILKKVARINGNLKPKNQDVVDLALQISSEMIKYLDEETFQNITGFSKV